LEIARTILSGNQLGNFHSKSLDVVPTSAWFTSNVKEFIQKANPLKQTLVRIFLGISREFCQRPEFSPYNTLLWQRVKETAGQDLYYIDEKGKKTTMSLNMEHLPLFVVDHKS